MTRRRTILGWLCAMLVLGAIGPAYADAATKDQLKERFRQRDPELRQLKDQGQVGETFEGYVEALPRRDPDAAARKLIDDENADRKALYAIIAREQQVPEEAVAAQAARGNFRFARKGDWLRHPDGWKQKD